ncbi:oligosaccharide repeat unit polymerase [Photobacterium profundum]|uniref:Putative membrane protein of ExoQ family, involved in exopolysaccharide production n=1 Tax=Photobacterium profundum 3TCK TaxID=314280 RepID=Q1YW44_9GAMM|nr:O-antigen ligase family protein [Photobacterium profundum]EAS40532.1 Putative membrane protein of ExoQ family, involved in exopolysaccharide production [Photobacterium profundum 3TCK]PSV61287.1 oligosaccharide repeat unit polymerase [Photobacterium profundum]
MKRCNQLWLAFGGCILTYAAWALLGTDSLLLCAIIIFPFIINHSFTICVFFILFSYFRLHEAFPILMPLHIPLLLATFSIAGLCIHLWLKRDEIHWHSLQTFFLLFSFWVFISCLLATNRAEAFATFNNSFIKIIIMVFAISWLPTKQKQLKPIPILLILCGVSLSILALYNSINGIGLVEGTRVTIGRDIGSILGDPNDLSLALLFPLSFALTNIFQGSKAQRTMTALFMIILVSGIIATQSRGGLLGITSAFFTLMLLRSRSIIIPSIISGIGLILLVVFAGISDRSSGGSGEEGIDESSMGRLFAWEAAFRMALANPLTGVGLDNFYFNYFFYSPHWDGKNHAVHSTWFQILGETGFIGFLLFICLLVGTFTLSYQLLNRLRNHEMKPIAEGLWIGLITFCVSGTFLTQGTTWPLYILISLLIALDRLTSNVTTAHSISAQ